MSTEPRFPPLPFSPHRAALPLKDAMRFVRGSLRAGVHRSAAEPMFPALFAQAADEILSAAETMVRGVVAGDRDGQLLRGFPYAPALYFTGRPAAGLSPRRLFVKAHYALAKHLTREAAHVSFICETAIDAAYEEVRRGAAGDDGVSLAVAITLALLHQHPIHIDLTDAEGERLAAALNRTVFVSAGLATAAAGLAAQSGAPGDDVLTLAGEVVRARKGDVEAALAAPHPQAALRELFAAFAPLLL